MRLVLCTFLARDYPLPPYACAALEAYVRARRGELGAPLSTSTLPFHADTPVRTAATQIRLRRPDVVGVSCYIWNYQATLELLPLLRRFLPDACIILGGPHVSEDLDQFSSLGQDGTVDFIVTGDGEEVLFSILKEIAASSGPAPAHTGGRTAAAWLPGMVTDLDSLPSPYRLNPTLLPTVRQSGIAFIETSRGCAFTCSFCDQGWRKVRQRSLELIEADLRFLRRHGARRIIFFDPTFNFHRWRTLRLLAFIAQETHGLSIHAEVKADLLNDEEIAALAALPNTSVEVGLQSSNEATLRRIQRPTNLARLGKNVAALTERGVTVYINTIYGLPGEDLRDWLRTLDFCHEIGDVVITASALKILPNTDLYRQQGTFAYAYDPENMFRVVQSGSMSEEELALAHRLSGALDEMQHQPQAVRAATRALIDNHYRGSLTEFLLASEPAVGARG